MPFVSLADSMYSHSDTPILSRKVPPTSSALLRSRGFSLIELMVAITILAILLALAVPSFQDMIQRNRVRTAAADLSDSLNLARSEAIKRGSSTRLCIDDENAWTVELISDGSTLREGHLVEQADLSGSSGLDTTSVADNLCVRFRPDGLAYDASGLMDAGELVIEVGSHSRTVNIKVGSIHVTES